MSRMSNPNSSVTDLGYRLSQVRQADHKIILMEFQKRVHLTAPPVTLGADQQGDMAIFPLLAARHGGMANTSFCDGHIERLSPQIFNGTNGPIIMSMYNENYYHYLSYDMNR